MERWARGEQLEKSPLLILGAGASGLMCARTLRAAGQEVTVLEARERIGGRIHTVSAGPEAEWPIELGAEFIHGKAPLTRRLLRDLKLSWYELPGDFQIFSQGRRRDCLEFWEELSQVFSQLKETRRDRSFEEFLRESGLPTEKRKLGRSFVEGFHAAPSDKISANVLHEASAQVSDPEERKMARVLGGYGEFIRRLSSDLDSSLQLGRKVQELQWREGKVLARGRDLRSGRTFTHIAEKAVITLPPVLLRRKLRFSPTLPEAYQRSIEGIQPGTVVRLSLEFTPRFYAESFPEPLPFISAPELPFMTWWSARPLSWPIVTAWAGGEHALRLGQCSDEEKVAQAVRDFSQLTGIPIHLIRSGLQNVHHHSWADDENSLLAYSYLSVGNEDAQDAISEPISRTLYFAGEALSPEHSGTVEGALKTGERAARKILEDLQREFHQARPRTGSHARGDSSRDASRSAGPS